MTTGLLRFRSPLLAESLLMSFPPGTEMFQFPGFASRTYVFSTGSPCGGVSPFGHPRINDCSHLPAAFRSVPRPSSPPGAKASTERPYHAREPSNTARAQDQTAQRVASPARLANRSVGAGTTHASTNFTHISDKPSHPVAPSPRPLGQTIHPPDPIHRLKEHARPGPKPRLGNLRGKSRTQPDQPNTLRMEASGFEPLTPCLQSRCSTS